jgi:Zn-dependent protease
MKRLGLQTSGMWFLPFLGAAAVAKQPFRWCGEEYFVAIAGPVFGLLSLVPLSAAALLVPNDWVPAGDWLGYVATAAFVNLFNLLPIGILDGGRIVKSLASSLSRVLGFIVVGGGLLLCGALVAWIGGFVLGIILCLSIVELFRRRKQAPLPPMSRRAVLGGVAAYVGLFGAFAAVAMSALHLAQSLGAA